jgi:hypothetical protein
MKKSILLLFLLLTLQAPAEQASPVPFEAPQGWREEVIKMPPEFAPDMSWKGVEVLKFSPGMFKAGAPDFFSYLFLLKLDEGTPDWDEQLMLYYGGLAKAVAKDPRLDVSGFELRLEGQPEARYGRLTWTEPFITKRAQILNLECHQLSPDVWFVCASPQPPDRPVWTLMRQIRNDLDRTLGE